jgi:hypothetical protein
MALTQKHTGSGGNYTGSVEDTYANNKTVRTRKYEGGGEKVFHLTNGKWILQSGDNTEGTLKKEQDLSKELNDTFFKQEDGGEFDSPFFKEKPTVVRPPTDQFGNEAVYWSTDGDGNFIHISYEDGDNVA